MCGIWGPFLSSELRGMEPKPDCRVVAEGEDGFELRCYSYGLWWDQESLFGPPGRDDLVESSDVAAKSEQSI